LFVAFALTLVETEELVKNARNGEMQGQGSEGDERTHYTSSSMVDGGEHIVE